MTALMALFMVLWLTSQDKKILVATAEYFRKPFAAMEDKSVGVMQGKDGGSEGDDKNRGSATAANFAFLNALAKELNRMLNVNDVSQENPAEVEITNDGLKVTLFDRGKQPFFEKNTANLTQWGKFALQSLAWLIERNRLRVGIAGHAAVGTTLPTKEYGLWELTADRANTSRRMLETTAVSPDKIDRVVGYADTKPLPNVQPTSQSNQRLTVTLCVN
jgi:chemotaxis protein MotB